MALDTAGFDRSVPVPPELKVSQIAKAIEYILTHPEIRPVLAARAAALVAALPSETVDSARIQAQSALLDASLYTRLPASGPPAPN